jgi:hypothetical protein
MLLFLKYEKARLAGRAFDLITSAVGSWNALGQFVGEPSANVASQH